MPCVGTSSALRRLRSSAFRNALIGFLLILTPPVAQQSTLRVLYVTPASAILPTGTYTATYVARATTAGRFIRPPSRAEEMYNAATGGRSEGGIFVVTTRER